MSDQFRHENQILKTAAQAKGKLKRPTRQNFRGTSAHKQGDAFGAVGVKHESKRDKCETPKR